MPDSRYLTLLARVKTVSEEAYLWILETGTKLDSFKEAYLLKNCFCWRDTEQGFEYWLDISRKIGQ